MANDPSSSSSKPHTKGNGKPQAKAKGKGKPNGPKVHSKQLARKTKRSILDQLQSLVSSFSLPPAQIESFTSLPLSQQTLKGLKKGSFISPTPIQRLSIPPALQGRDVLATAQTGSGKTLAFLIPLLENLLRKKWGAQDGLGALVISPTRELALQIFSVLRSIGAFHEFSAGLVIGGSANAKALKDEKERVGRMNVLVGTPGRILQHMDETVGFDCTNVQVLVVDEADRILDMGFRKTVDAIVGHLPKKRQTLLFSATRGRGSQGVDELARLSLDNPLVIDSTTSTSATTTTEGTTGETSNDIPPTLAHNYVLTPLHLKLSTLFTFLKTHLSSKILVFLSTCKQVRHAHTTFCLFHPGIPLLHLHGKQKQSLRLKTYERFVKMPKAVLLATDVAARGLDFPGVDWVIQVDCPVDAETYVHRVGRTARAGSVGKALMFVMPEEEPSFLKMMKSGLGVEMTKVKARESKRVEVRGMMQKACFEDVEVKYLAQRAFVAYLRSLWMKGEETLLAKLDVDEYAESLGLGGTPKVKFVKKAREKVRLAEAEEHGEEEEEGKKETKVRTKYDRMVERKNQSVLSEHYNKLIDESSSSEDSDSGSEEDGESNSDSGSEKEMKKKRKRPSKDEEDDDLFTLARANHDLDEGMASLDMMDTDNLSNRKKKMSKTKRLLALASAPLPSTSTSTLSNPTLSSTSASTSNIPTPNPNPIPLIPKQSTKTIFTTTPTGELISRPYYSSTHDSVDSYYASVGGYAGALVEARKYTNDEERRMREVSVVDREEARVRRREERRRRKEKEREREGGVGGGGVAVLGSEDEDADGYVSPVFDIPEVDSDEEDVRGGKMRRVMKESVARDEGGDEDEEMEEMALRLLS